MPGENLQPTDGRCGQYTHKYNTKRVAQHDHISSREHAWPKSCRARDCTSVCPQNNCHPRVMSHSLPHLTLTTNTGSLSPISTTSPMFPAVSSAHTRSMILDHIYHAMFHGRVADQHKSRLSYEKRVREDLMTLPGESWRRRSITAATSELCEE